MILQYSFGGSVRHITIRWTADTGRSVVFRDIVRALMDKHRLKLEGFLDFAGELDDLADKLYDLIYIYTNEYTIIPYNPRFRSQVINAFAELTLRAGEAAEMGKAKHGPLLSSLFAVILDKLQETVDVFLEDNAYHDKYRYRRRKLEQAAETTNEGQMSFEFEDLLLQMTDLSRQLDCLTDTQRGRLVKHIFLKYTTKEIAEQEGVHESVVQKSVSTALVKLRQQLS